MTDEPDVPKEQPESTGQDEPAASPHDALFYKTFSKPEHAAAEMKCIFEPDFVARVEWDSLQPMPNKFVDAKLTGRYADVLYSVRIGGRETLFYFLLEHKSDSDPWTPLQLLE
jgi:predicted transposase YdaD